MHLSVFQHERFDSGVDKLRVLASEDGEAHGIRIREVNGVDGLKTAST